MPNKMTVDSNIENISLNVAQARVIEAVSPTIDLERVSDGLVVTVKDVQGAKSSTVYDGSTGAQGEPGEKGETGAPGADGISPTITITDITGGHRVTITDATGRTRSMSWTARTAGLCRMCRSTACRC